ncbi:MAG TPA: DNA repair protein RecN, partial [bacterium]|nr:DNA repair protein RecN [bacterium]
MLTRLAISNLATIHSLAVDWEEGFTVLTGETGAGKSILIDALRLVLGGKAGPDRVRGGAAQTVVEATFDLARLPQVRSALQELGIPADEDLVLRRVLQENGRSRALANDCAISQPRLEELGTYLVNIHGQHDNQMLLNTARHLDFLDAFGELLPLREQVAALHGEHAGLRRQLTTLLAAQAGAQQTREALQAEVEEIRAADPRPGEEESLRQEVRLLAHAEQLAALAQGATELLQDGDAALLGRLALLHRTLEQAAQVDARLTPLAEQVQPLRYQLEDVYRSVQAYAAGLEQNPQRLEQAQARLAQIERLKRKYGDTVDAVLARLARREAQLAQLDQADDSRLRLERECADVAGRLHALATGLSHSRRECARRLDGQLLQELHELGMTHAQFVTRIATLDASEGAEACKATGLDSVEFLLSTNPGQEPRPLARIASGGELSRTMLALKTVLAGADPTRTLIFDEVDAGISGATAEVVGRKLRSLGASHQVLCVTHLPQIAALGRQHYGVTKHTDGRQTYTQVQPLHGDARVQEV